jgi:hypothetical protein
MVNYERFIHSAQWFVSHRIMSFRAAQNSKGA